MNKLLNIVVIRFGDLFLKGKNRSHFINQLNRQVKKRLGDKHQVTKKHDMIEVQTDNYEEVVKITSKIFGISRIDVGFKTERDLDVASKQLVKVAKKLEGTFKVDCKRQDKQFEIKSDQAKLVVASHILKDTDLKVDVKKPDHVFKTLITRDEIFILALSFKGKGGMPSNTSGKVLVLLSGGIDSPVAAYKMASRGVHVDFLHFETPPHTSFEALTKVYDLVEEFKNIQFNSKLFVSDFTPIQNEIACACEESYRITLMRRYFLRIASQFALEQGYGAIVTGDSLGQVASQTLESIHTINEAATVPVLRPLLCDDKNDIIKIAKEINTYEISIRPHDDCCATFVPKNPVTKPRLGTARAEEEKVLAFGIVEKTVEDIQIMREVDETKKKMLCPLRKKA